MSHYRKITVKDKEFEWCVTYSGAFVRGKDSTFKTTLTDEYLDKITPEDKDKQWGVDGTGNQLRLGIKPSYIKKAIELNF